MAATYLVIDIGGTFVKYALMDAEGQFLSQGKVPARTHSLEELTETMAELKEVAGSKVSGVAVSMPGRIDTARGIAYTGGAFTWIHDTPIAAELEGVFGVPVTIANDGKCAALAEAWTGALADVESGCVLVLGTGIGGGVVLGHHVLMGATGAAAELSFMPYDYEGIHERPSASGSIVHAMWCDLVSAGSITRNYARAKGLERADGIMLLDAYEAGEAEAVAVMEQFGRDMAAGIFSIQGVLDLERFAIGGGISARPEVTEIVRAATDALWEVNSWTPYAKPEIVTCKFGNEANLIGALAFHLESRA